MANDQLLRFASVAELNRALADEISTRLKQSIETRESASLVVSGGTTPGPLFDELSGRELAWNKVTITLADERWVAATEDGSNEKLVRERLLKGRAAAAHFVPLKTDDARPEDAAPKVQRAIAALPRPFDVVLLGMGDDGHTASLYPDSPELAQALDMSEPAMVLAVHADSAKATSVRITLTLRALLDARFIAILVRGKAKRDTLQKALDGDDVAQMPVRAVLVGPVPVQAYWSP